MKTKYLLPVMALAFTAVALTSCEDFLETEYLGGSQDKQQVQKTVTAIPNRVNASVAGMYLPLKQPWYYFGAESGRADDCGYPAVALGQDLNSGDMVNIVSGYDWFSVALEWSDRNPQYANPMIRYGLFYDMIYATKEVLASVPDDATDPDLIAKRGQAKALRAFAYLSLAPYFQFNYVDHKDADCIPLIKDGTDFRNNPRATCEEVYAEILADLTGAIADLDGFQRANKGEVNKQVAYGLRARANLYMENWEAAAADADSALVGATPYTLEEIAANPMFCDAADASWIWGLILPVDAIGPATSGRQYATWPSQLGSFSSNAYVPFAGIYRQINSLLWNKISDTDVRRAWWLNEDKYSPYLKDMTWVDVDGGVSYSDSAIVDAKIADIKEPMPQYTNVKFCGKAGCGAATNEGDWCMMRAEEMILIKAEALAKAGDEAAGKAVLAELMAQRDPQYKQTCLTFADEVWLQRRIELWGEGFAMADVMRLKKNVVNYHEGDEATNVPVEYQFNVEYGNPWMLLRFTQSETNNNVGIVNNTGGSQPNQGDGASLLDGVTD